MMRGARSSAVPRRVSARKTTSCSRPTPDTGKVLVFPDAACPGSILHMHWYTLLIMDSGARLPMEDWKKHSDRNLISRTDALTKITPLYKYISVIKKTKNTEFMIYGKAKKHIFQAHKALLSHLQHLQAQGLSCCCFPSSGQQPVNHAFNHRPLLRPEAAHPLLDHKALGVPHGSVQSDSDRAGCSGTTPTHVTRMQVVAKDPLN